MNSEKTFIRYNFSKLKGLSPIFQTKILQSSCQIIPICRAVYRIWVRGAHAGDGPPPSIVHFVLWFSCPHIVAETAAPASDFFFRKKKVIQYRARWHACTCQLNQYVWKEERLFCPRLLLPSWSRHWSFLTWHFYSYPVPQSPIIAWASTST